MNLEENWIKKKLKTWVELAPFYLDFAESVQCNFTVNETKWTVPNESVNSEGYYELDLLTSGQFEQNSFLTNSVVLYPTDDAVVDPTEMIRFDRFFISFTANKNKT